MNSHTKIQRGRPRQQSALWSSRKRKRRKIKERLDLGGEYTEADGTVWRYRADLIEDVPLHEYMTDEESLTIDEMYRLNTLEVGETFEMGVHFGFVTFTRIT